MRLSLYVFGDHADPIVHDLEEPAANGERDSPRRRAAP